MRQGYVGVLLICACGARSEIAGEGESWDSSFDVDGSSSDVAKFGDADTGSDVDACTAATTSIACGGQKGDNCSTCKFDIEWTCGDVKHRIGGACDPPDAGGPFAGTYDGVCDENGSQTSSFEIPTTTCDCKDASALLTIVQAQCTHQ